MASYISFRKKYEENPDLKQIMHHHNGFEIVLFKTGKTKVVTYENTYDVGINDVFFFSAREMHGIVVDNNAPYMRYVLYLDDDFFEEMGCTHYRNMLTERKPGTENKISAEKAEKYGIIDCIMKIEKYCSLFMTPYDAVARAAVVELLHLMSLAGEAKGKEIFEKEELPDVITDVIEYLNEHIAERVELDKLAEMFHFSKNHLCRLFKNATGYTIVNYVNRQRIDKARIMHREGYSMYDAAVEVGFGSYSSFYRTFIKEYGRTPREDALR